MGNVYLEQNKKNSQIIRRVSIITLIINIVLTALKMTFGAVFFNVSVISDAVHSLSDVGTTVLVLIAVFISKPHSDKKHNYGHEKIEPMLVLFFALILGAVGVLLGVQGVKGIISPKEVTVNYYLIGVTILSVISKEAMYWYTIHFAKKTKSNALKADAWHHRSDSLSSVAVLIGLICSPFIKSDLIESIAVLIVAALIIKVTVQILMSSINQLIDKAVDDAVYEELITLVKETENVVNVDKFKTRLFGNAIYVDIEISVKGDLTVIESHEIAQIVHDKLESQQKHPVKHCHVHINPAANPPPVSDSESQEEIAGMPQETAQEAVDKIKKEEIENSTSAQSNADNTI